MESINDKLFNQIKHGDAEHQAWLKAELDKFFSSQRTLDNTTADHATKQVSDIKFWGNGDMWKLLGKASSKSEGWMKSSKAMEVPHGCVVQVTTQQGEHVAEAVTFVPGVKIEEIRADDSGLVIGRKLVSI